MEGKSSRKRIVLYVEDDDASAYLLSLALKEQDASVDVFQVHDGEDAMSFLNRAGAFANAPFPDAIVLDINLPKKNGHEILAELRKHPDWQHVPVIMFSSSAQATDRERALSLGANGYILKVANLAGVTAAAMEILQYISTRPAAAAGE